MAKVSNTFYAETDFKPPKGGKDFLQESLKGSFAFNMTQLVEHMMTNQDELHQLLTATTAQAITDISNTANPNETAAIKSIEVVTKAIEDSSAIYINLIRELSVEIGNAIKIIKQ